MKFRATFTRKAIALFLLLTPLTFANDPVKASVLWDTWYTVTAEGGIHYGYYNDRFEKKGDKIAFRNQFWRLDEGHVNEEQVVAISADDSALTPEFWNYHRSYRATTLDVDGSFKGNILTAKVRQDAQSIAPISHSVSRSTFLSVLFPVWIHKNREALKPGHGKSFNVIYEDDQPGRFMAKNGTLKLEAADPFAVSTKSAKISATIDGNPSIWYVLDTGEPIRIDMPARKLKIVKVPEAIARRFLIATPEKAGK